MAQNQAGQEKIIYNSKKRKINKSPKITFHKEGYFFMIVGKLLLITLFPQNGQNLIRSMVKALQTLQTAK